MFTNFVKLSPKISPFSHAVFLYVYTFFTLPAAARHTLFLSAAIDNPPIPVLQLVVKNRNPKGKEYEIIRAGEENYSPDPVHRHPGDAVGICGAFRHILHFY